MVTDRNVPHLLLVINGGASTLKTINTAMAHGTPVVVVAASGGIATAIWQYFDSGGSINHVDPQYQTQGEIRGGIRGGIRERDLRAGSEGKNWRVGSEGRARGQDPRTGSEGGIRGQDPRAESDGGTRGWDPNPRCA